MREVTSGGVCRVCVEVTEICDDRMVLKHIAKDGCLAVPRNVFVVYVWKTGPSFLLISPVVSCLM